MTAPAKLRLTDTQLTLLGQFAVADGRRASTRISSGDRRSCTGLCKRGLLQRVGNNRAGTYELTPAGWTTLGLKPPSPKPERAEFIGSEAPSEIEEGKREIGLPRPGSKLSRVVDLLRDPEGGSLDLIRESTGWLPHTCRAALTGLRKRGYQIARDDSTLPANYRITGYSAPESQP